ncbi:hypothetical protein BJY00DRAFT_319827 [Aspergillus carlsbadensis]|nr:hypothetical protein BJY00DRAFT_319827 [Aspergillus carlsbadensis]
MRGHTITKRDPGLSRLEWEDTTTLCAREPPNRIVYGVQEAAASSGSLHYTAVVDDGSGVDWISLFPLASPKTIVQLSEMVPKDETGTGLSPLDRADSGRSWYDDENSDGDDGDDDTMLIEGVALLRKDWVGTMAWQWLFGLLTRVL